jgi:hypothetical protein
MMESLRRIGVSTNATPWSYTNRARQKVYLFHLAENPTEMNRALCTERAHIIIQGHSNYGLGSAFASDSETARQTVAELRYMDDDRLLSHSTLWVAINVPNLLSIQSYPNWWPVFKDGTSAILPYDFNDPRGNPPYNYLLTYQVPGDPIRHKIEPVPNSALERFPGSGCPAWYSADGSAPDPKNSEHLRYFITNTNASCQVVGKWRVATPARGCYGSNYLYSAAGAGSNQVRWVFSAPLAALYTVSACWPAFVGNASNAQYCVTHALGNTTLTANQRGSRSYWKYLGVFFFNAGENSIGLTDKLPTGSGNVVADAIRITSLTNAQRFDQIIDNSAWPKPHYAKRTILFRKPLAVDPGQFRYRRMFFDGCYSGPYYLGAFNHGLVFYTVGDSGINGSETYLRSYLSGEGDEQIWADLQDFQPVYDYFDFTCPPVRQPLLAAGSSTKGAVSFSEHPGGVGELAGLPPGKAFEFLKADEFVHNAAAARAAARAAFTGRQAEGVALALGQMPLPVIEKTDTEMRNRVRAFLAARRILEAFPDQSVPALRELFSRSDSVTRGNILQALAPLANEPMRQFLMEALADKRFYGDENPPPGAEPMRVCDLAYNQLVLRWRTTGVLRTLSLTYSLAVRDYQIAELKKRL